MKIQEVLKDAEEKENIARGLRAMKTVPDALLAINSDSNRYHICGLPVYYSTFINNTMTDDDIPFMPLWGEAGEYGEDRRMFNEGYMGYT